ncbi:MAG: putative DNA-binding protein [Clostridiales bacterium]|nr:putative DNA-binding protein [Clostridiales bacterium]HBM81661.1 putative DNA-binding protein [Clostridiaceae bacterium]
MVEKFFEVNMLYDFYGQLLTDKQKNIIELYYNNNLSLGEISEIINISRQGVFDLLKRSEKQLYYYESKLKLVKKFMDYRKKLSKVYSLMDNKKNDADIDKAKALLNEIIKNDL